MSLILNVVKESEHSGKFPSPFDCYCALAARYAGVELEFNEIDIAEKEHQEESFMKKTPVGTVPVLEVEGKGTIWESNAIATYLSSIGNNKILRGEGFHAAQVDEVVDMISQKFSHVVPLVHHVQGTKKLTKPEMKDVETALQNLLVILGGILDKETFVAGTRHISLADLAVFSRFRLLFEKHWEPEEREKLPKSFVRWFNTISQQEEVVEVCGKTKLKEKVEKKIESKFNLEDWKRTYMNNGPDVFLDYFWKNLDVRVNSIWFADYKYSNELTVSYKSGNLLGGVQQRMAPFNKTTFGVLLMTGTEEAQHLTCLWVFESKTVPKDVVEGIDYEVFDFKRADWKDDKEKVNLYLKAKKVEDNVVIDGKHVLDIKRLL
jgi:glutathione S-transferase